MWRHKGFLKSFVIFLTVLFGAAGCGEKQEVGGITPSSEEGTETLSYQTSEPAPGVTVVSVASSPSEPATLSLAVAPLPQDSFESTKTIQVALRYAGFYTGTIDGKAGPLTRKAIEEFQQAKGLKVDGKVGSGTWGELGKYLPAGAEE